MEMQRRPLFWLQAPDARGPGRVRRRDWIMIIIIISIIIISCFSSSSSSSR